MKTWIRKGVHALCWLNLGILIYILALLFEVITAPFDTCVLDIDFELTCMLVLMCGINLGLAYAMVRFRKFHPCTALTVLFMMDLAIHRMHWAVFSIDHELDLHGFSNPEIFALLYVSQKTLLTLTLFLRLKERTAIAPYVP